MLMSAHRPLGDLENPSEFIARHIGISAQDETLMLGVIGEASRRALIESIVPRAIARSRPAVSRNASACRRETATRRARSCRRPTAITR